MIYSYYKAYKAHTTELNYTFKKGIFSTILTKFQVGRLKFSCNLTLSVVSEDGGKPGRQII